jgi:hypothetical protein
MAIIVVAHARTSAEKAVSVISGQTLIRVSAGANSTSGYSRQFLGARL